MRAKKFAIAALLLLAVPFAASAATNSVKAGIGGVGNGTVEGGDGTGSASVTIGQTGLRLRKQARDLAGNPLPDGSAVAASQTIYFLLWVSNPTPFPVGDLRIVDPLNESEFTYVADSLQGAVAPLAAEANLWDAVWSPLSDTGSDDGASAADTGGNVAKDRITLGMGSDRQNREVVIPPLSIVALRFKVQVN
jgi:hypothetical protein